MCLLQQSLVIESYVKMLVRRVPLDRYRITQEQFQYQGVEICIMFRTYAIYQISSKMLIFDKGYSPKRIFLLLGSYWNFSSCSPKLSLSSSSHLYVLLHSKDIIYIPFIYIFGSMLIYIHLYILVLFLLYLFLSTDAMTNSPISETSQEQWASCSPKPSLSSSSLA